MICICQFKASLFVQVSPFLAASKRCFQAGILGAICSGCLVELAAYEAAGPAACFAAKDAAVDAEDGPSDPEGGESAAVEVCRADANLPLRKSEMEAAADLGASGMALELIAVSA